MGDLNSHISRRAALSMAAGAAGSLAFGAAAKAATLSANDPIPDVIPSGTKLVIGDPITQMALQLSGEDKKLPFHVEWANISGGPQTIEAFRANALDLGTVADIPPIHATWTNLKVKVVAARFRQDPINHPIYVIGVAPGSGIERLEDLKGRKIAFSPGQAQGALILRLLKKLGFAHSDVQLVEFPSVGDTYVNALASKLVDAAPIADANKERFVRNYARDGAKILSHGLRDDPWYLYLQDQVLADPGKAAAVKAYVEAWGRALRWVDNHPEEWVAGYFVKNQGLKEEAGRYLVEANGHPDVPTTWADVIVRQQETIDLLAAELKRPTFKAEDLFDRRFEAIAGKAYAEA